MTNRLPPALDLTPPPFADGLCDWSRTDGTPDSPTYETGEAGRIARNDRDFGLCLELRLVETLQRLRYMGELPLRRGYCVEVRVRVKALRGPIPIVRIAAWPGAFGGAGLPDLPIAARDVRPVVHDAVTELRAVIGRDDLPGVDLVWDERALFAHVGIDLIGGLGGVVRVEDFVVREIVLGAPKPLPGFAPEDAGVSVEPA